MFQKYANVEDSLFDRKAEMVFYENRDKNI